MSESGRSFTLIVQKSAWGCTASLYLSAPPWMKKNPTKLNDAKAILTFWADKTNITLEWIYWQDSSQTQSFWEVDHSLVFHLAVHTTPKHFSISANLHLDESHVGLNGLALKTLCRIRDKMLRAYKKITPKVAALVLSWMLTYLVEIFLFQAQLRLSKGENPPAGVFYVGAHWHWQQAVPVKVILLKFSHKIVPAVLSFYLCNFAGKPYWVQ